MIEDWLLVKEDYHPGKGKDRFIDKSIVSFLKAVALIRQSGYSSSLSRINPSLRVVTTLLSLVLISLTRSFTFLFIVDGLLLLQMIRLDPRERKRMIVLSLVFPLIALIALIPAMLQGSLLYSLLLCQKMVTSILSVHSLSMRTKWSELSRALKSIFVPDLVIWIIDITLKYIVLLGEYSTNLLYALKLRSIGQTKDKFGAVSGVMGNLFLKSCRMGEEMADAMECRGFVGEYRLPVKLRLTRIDYLYILLNLLLVSFFLYEYVWR
ncbi:MAG: energy-coupling factor transporter transmembrane protein EcfT [Gorillibacterium sp.]|nr:energy-coupling factor transporter transmembrane protein EcfT [Gorillibacterium sp.]